MPAFVVRHGRVEYAEKQMTIGHNLREEIQTGLETSRCGTSAGVNREIETVDLLPHFKRDVLPRDPGIFAGGGNC